MKTKLRYLFLASLLTFSALFTNINADASIIKPAEEAKKMNYDKSEIMAIEGNPFLFENEAEVTVKSIRKGTTYDGKEAVILTYDYRNLSNKEASPFSSLGIKMFQRDKELPTGFSPDVKDNTMKSVLYGEEIKDCQAVFMGNSKNGELKVEISPLFKSISKKVTFKTEYPVK